MLEILTCSLGSYKEISIFKKLNWEIKMPATTSKLVSVYCNDRCFDFSVMTEKEDFWKKIKKARNVGSRIYINTLAKYANKLEEIIQKNGKLTHEDVFRVSFDKEVGMIRGFHYGSILMDLGEIWLYGKILKECLITPLPTSVWLEFFPEDKLLFESNVVAFERKQKVA